MGLLRVRLREDAPRRTLACVLVLALVQPSLALPAVTGALPPSLVLSLPFLTTALMQVVVCLLLAHRARHAGVERDLWSRTAASAAVIASTMLVWAIVGGIAPARQVLDVVNTLVPVVTFLLLYGALVRWNRYSVAFADPDDKITGVSSVFIGVALIALVVPRRPSGGGVVAQLVLHGPDLQAASMLVLLGTAVTVALMARLARDLRVWLLATSYAAGLASAAASVQAAPLVAASLWAVATASVAVAASLQPPPTERVPAAAAHSTIGAFVVLLMGLGFVLSQVFWPADPVVALAAAAGALGASLRLLVNVHDLAALATHRREALTDELTALANRRAVLRQLDDWLDEGIPVALALVDLDKFKEVNDGLGHEAGDDLLRQVAARLSDAMDEGELLGRLGGDEFAVVARADSGSSPDGCAAWLGGRIVAAMGEPFVVGGRSVHVTLSVGVAALAQGERDDGAAAELLRLADAAMYDAKRSGRGLALYDSERHVDGGGVLALVEDLRVALATGQVVLHHQPQMDVATGALVGVEALVRWQHPERGLLSPAEFLGLAELHGLMGALTDEVLAQAVAQAAAWQRAGTPIRISVNLSTTNLLDAGLPDRLAGLLLAHGVPATSLVLEVTEDVVMSDSEQSRAVLRALAELGSEISIDDFGTGYSSLTYLRELPVSELKLDRSFTKDLLTDPRAEAIIASTITLAHALGLRVVAEGVEDVETFMHLRGLGCDESQGYLHSRPLPASALQQWLALQPGRHALQAPGPRRGQAQGRPQTQEQAQALPAVTG